MCPFRLLDFNTKDPMVFLFFGLFHINNNNFLHKIILRDSKLGYGKVMNPSRYNMHF
jgi:hypothetical protein